MATSDSIQLNSIEGDRFGSAGWDLRFKFNLVNVGGGDVLCFGGYTVLGSVSSSLPPLYRFLVIPSARTPLSSRMIDGRRSSPVAQRSNGDLCRGARRCSLAEPRSYDGTLIRGSPNFARTCQVLISLTLVVVVVVAVAVANQPPAAECGRLALF